jgi:hypothetical protein
MKTLVKGITSLRWPWDVIPPANYKVTNSVGNLPQIVAMSKAAFLPIPLQIHSGKLRIFQKEKR